MGLKARIEYAEFGYDGAGWYVLSDDPVDHGAFVSQTAAEVYAKKEGYEVEPTKTIEELHPKLARHAEDQGPFPTRYLVRAPFAWLGYWFLSGVDFVLRKLSSVVWQARWRLGVVMFDRPCPRCGDSLWSGLRGCNCRLVVSGYEAHFELPREAKIDDMGERRIVRYKVGLRRDLFHWARSLDFFLSGAVEALEKDDRVYRELHRGEQDLMQSKGTSVRE